MRIKDLISNAFYGGMYNVALITPNDSVDVRKTEVEKTAHWIDMNGYTHGWFADPFIYDVKDDVIEVLVEEYEYHNSKGKLSMITVDKKTYKLLKVDEILCLDTHLSFPNIFRDGDKVYVYPENSEGGRLKIYEFDYQNKKMVEIGVLVEKPLLDSQLLKIDDSYYVFGIERPKIRGDYRIEQIFKSSSLFGPYEKTQEIVNEKNEQRGAGAFFYDNGSLIRPAQCCEGGYGKGVIFYEISFDNNMVKEKMLGRISPNPKGNWTQQLHTFNRHKGWTIIDGYEYFHPTLNKLVSLVRPIKG